MDDKTISEEYQKALNHYHKSVLIDPEKATERLFESHTEIITTHQCDLNVEYVNKISSGR